MSPQVRLLDIVRVLPSLTLLCTDMSRLRKAYLGLRPRVADGG